MMPRFKVEVLAAVGFFTCMVDKRVCLSIEERSGRILL
jgi:hypothetical protein